MSDDVTKPFETADDDMRIGGLTKAQADELAAYIAEKHERQFIEGLGRALERRRDRVTVPSGTYISPASRDE